MYPSPERDRADHISFPDYGTVRVVIPTCTIIIINANDPASKIRLSFVPTSCDEC